MTSYPHDFYDDGLQPGGPDDTPEGYWDQEEFSLPDGYEASPPVSSAWGGARSACAERLLNRVSGE